MKFSTTLLAIVPPTLAIIVEWLSIVREERLRRDATTDFQDYYSSNPERREELIDDIVLFSGAAVECTGLAPTFVACLSSCFAIFDELEKPFVPIAIYLLIFGVLILLLMRILSGQSFLELADTRPSITIFVWPVTPPFGVKIISYFVYAANLIFIAYVIVLYWIYKAPLTAPPTVHH